MTQFFLFFLIIFGLAIIIISLVLKYILSKKHFEKYCKFIIYTCFIISLILTIKGYIFEIYNFKPFLTATICSGGVIITLRSAQNNQGA